MKWRAVLIDDERLARKRLRELLGRHPEIEIVGEADDEESALAAVGTLRPDLLFLDMELSPGHGLDLLPRLSYRPTTVFVTAHDTFAVRAFDVCAFDYLLKPVSAERLAQTVERLRASAGPREGSAPEGVRMTDQVVLKDSGTVKIVEASQIAAIKAEGAYSRVLLRDAAPMMVLRGLSEWERILPADGFARVDRSLIVQPALVRQIEATSRDEATVAIDGLATRLSLGRAALARLRRCLSPARG